MSHDIVSGSLSLMAVEVPKSTRLSGHTNSLLCCHSPLSNPSLLATSGQDGRVCLFDLRNKDNVQKFECFGQEGVSSICFTLATSDIFYAAAGASIYCIDLRLGSSAGGAVKKYSYNSEEINQVALNQKASYLAAADDSGEIKVIDLHSHKLLKTLRGIHTNICSTVQFHPQRPWELMTGGLDAKIVKWDFCTGKPLKVVDQGVGASQTSSGQFCNPPFVHVLATPEGKLSGEAGRVMAVAKGNGVVEVCDLALENWQKLRPHRTEFKYLDKDKKRSCKAVQPVETSDRADDTVEGHMSAVSCVTFARFSQNRSLVVSGSNDRSIKLWKWCQKSGEVSSTSKNRGPMLLSIDHKRKVNWICTAASSSENVFVADTSNFLTVYTVI